MLKLFANWIEQILDLIYPLFRRWMPNQTFRYLACGGGNTVLDIIIYFVSYNFILDKKNVVLGGLTISPHIMAFIVSFLITFPLGFFLMSRVVFHDSNLKGRVQLFRYFLLVFVCIIINYVCLKVFVENLHIYPTPAKILTTIIVVSFSYLAQRNYTFKR
jgi:putative flippase GtrA